MAAPMRGRAGAPALAEGAWRASNRKVDGADSQEPSEEPSAEPSHGVNAYGKLSFDHSHYVPRARLQNIFMALWLTSPGPKDVASRPHELLALITQWLTSSGLYLHR